MKKFQYDPDSYEGTARRARQKRHVEQGRADKARKERDEKHSELSPIGSWDRPSKEPAKKRKVNKKARRDQDEKETRERVLGMVRRGEHPEVVAELMHVSIRTVNGIIRREMERHK